VVAQVQAERVAAAEREAVALVEVIQKHVAELADVSRTAAAAQTAALCTAEKKHAVELAEALEAKADALKIKDADHEAKVSAMNACQKVERMAAAKRLQAAVDAAEQQLQAERSASVEARTALDVSHSDVARLKQQMRRPARSRTPTDCSCAARA